MIYSLIYTQRKRVYKTKLENDCYNEGLDAKKQRSIQHLLGRDNRTGQLPPKQIIYKEQKL